ncbi:hypothetical protein RWV98_17595 [Agathobaculum sp. NTUH-O15-33]|uniref:hypothetical protein n=1 Tax=Agathobaculum sp. NTUH-O15-33 TaxID=3079302 RepID=UPI002958553A|nr:hypothetical protein [Agathobaculum sp. NTUH-O15-33]WNX84366.1 hypothetical protein RWV98_17595 [Agathobaculum sp. NTUH-O15-33]
MPDTTITGTGYIKREEFKLFADVSDTATPEWELQGDKVEDLSIEMNANVEKGTDVTGSAYADLDKYEEQTSVEPYRARKESKLFAILYDIVKFRKTLSDVQRKFLCVNIFKNASGTYDAWTQDCIIEVQSYGGDTKGLAIPYNIHWTGKRTYGTATISDSGAVTFTADVEQPTE